MISSWWFGVVLGGSITIASSVARALSHSLALHSESISDAMRATASGMLVRMAIFLIGMALVLATLPVHTTAFVGSMLGTLLISIAIELTTVWHRTEPT